MIAGVADTHTALWHLFDDDRLSRPARDFIAESAAAGRRIAVSAITLAEVVDLVEKSRVIASSNSDLKQAIADPGYVLTEVPLTAKVIRAMLRVPRQAVPDLPDRIVAATAVYLGVPILNRDGRIRCSALHTIW